MNVIALIKRPTVAGSCGDDWWEAVTPAGL